MLLLNKYIKEIIKGNYYYERAHPTVHMAGLRANIALSTYFR